MIVSILGLFLDIVGVLLLFAFGLPPPAIIIGALGKAILNDTEGIIKNELRLCEISSKTGLFLIVFGFALQIVGLLIQR